MQVSDRFTVFSISDRIANLLADWQVESRAEGRPAAGAANLIGSPWCRRHSPGSLTIR